MKNYIYLKPKIIAAILGSTVLIGILALVYLNIPLLFVEFKGEPVNYKDVDYPKESFEYLEDQGGLPENIDFNTETGKVGGIQTAKRAKIYALSMSQSTLILQWLPKQGTNENKSGVSSGELDIIYDCKRRSGCGDSDFEPINTYLIRNLLRDFVTVGGLRAIKDSDEGLERFDHWIERSKYFDRIMFPKYEMQPTEKAYLTPKFVISVGNKKSSLKINGKAVKMDRRGYINFYRHNLSTGIHNIEIDGEKSEIEFHENVPVITYYRNKLILDKRGYRDFRFENIIIESEGKRKTVELDFERNRSWTENYPPNPARRMQVPFNGSKEDMTVTLTHPDLNYTEELESENDKKFSMRRGILGLTEREMETYIYLVNLTGSNLDSYRSTF